VAEQLEWWVVAEQLEWWVVAEQPEWRAVSVAIYSSVIVEWWQWRFRAARRVAERLHGSYPTHKNTSQKNAQPSMKNKQTIHQIEDVKRSPIK
jgi:hypothetical protein